MLKTEHMCAIPRIDMGDEVGTGILITPDQVLTAFHVVESLDKGGLNKISFPTEPVIERCAVLIKHRDSKRDWAILSLDKPVEGITPLPLRPWAGERHWWGFGYPASAEGEKPLGGLHLGEGTIEFAEHSGRQPLQLKTNKPDLDTAGLSGSPCLVSGRVVGVLTRRLSNADENTPGGVLYATPVSSIIAAASLINAEALRHQKEAIDRLRKHFTALASTCKPSMALFRSFMDTHKNIDSSPLEDEKLFDSLINMSEEKVSNWLYHIFHKGYHEIAKKAGIIVVPVMADWRKVQLGQFRKIANNDVLISAPFMNKMFCEMFLAGLDGRPALIKKNSDGYNLPAPSILEAPIMNPDPDHMFYTVKKNLDLVSRDAAKYIIRDFGYVSPRNLHRTAAIYCKTICNRVDPAHYYMFIDHVAYPDLAERLRSELPDLWLVRMEEHEELIPIILFANVEKIYIEDENH